MLEALNTPSKAKSAEGTYVGEDIKDCPYGLYEIFWKSGGSSIASVGGMYDGARWIAPTNWTCEMDQNPGTMLTEEKLADIDKMVLLFTRV